MLTRVGTKSVGRRTGLISVVFLGAILGGCDAAKLKPEGKPKELYPQASQDYELFSRDDPRAGGFQLVLVSRSDDAICVPYASWPVPEWLLYPGVTAFRLGSISGWPPAVTVVSEGKRFPIRRSNIGHSALAPGESASGRDLESYGYVVNPRSMLVGFIPYAEFEGELNTDRGVSRTLILGKFGMVFCSDLLEGNIGLRDERSQ